MNKSDFYVKNAVKTESKDFFNLSDRLNSNQVLRLLHGSMGLCTESGELLDNLKKHIFYGKELDLVNLVEECGDLFWYLAIIHDAMGARDFDATLASNIKKLRARYGDKFNEEGALNRDLEKERSILEE
jgi:NTP pyrophosphatase (non-canonical NTP hydrolase)